MEHETDIPGNVDAMRHAGTEMAGRQGRKKAPRVPRKNAGKPKKVTPVVLPVDVVREFAWVTRYLPKTFETKARIAMVHFVLACSTDGRFAEEDIWHQIGSWTSRLRGMRDIDGITQKHHGQAAVQKILLAMRRAEHDPALVKVVRSHISRFIRDCLQALNAELTLLIQSEQGLELNPDEMMGMVPCNIDSINTTLFRKPRTKSRVVVRNEVEQPGGLAKVVPGKVANIDQGDDFSPPKPVSLVKAGLQKVRALIRRGDR